MSLISGTGIDSWKKSTWIVDFTNKIFQYLDYHIKSLFIKLYQNDPANMIWKRIVLSPYNYTWDRTVGYSILLLPERTYLPEKTLWKQIERLFPPKVSKKIKLIVLKAYDSQISRPMQYSSNVRHDGKDKKFNVLYS